MSVRGIFGGLLALTLLQAVLDTPESAQRTAGVWRAVTGGFRRFMSPTEAALPDLRERRKIVAPGPLDPGPIAPLDPSSSTLPDSWTTRPAPPQTFPA